MTKPEISGNGTQASVHLMLQGKEGVGGLRLSDPCPVLSSEVGTVNCLDTDPVNATFAQYQLLEA
jgi:hypothetical protein